MENLENKIDALFSYRLLPQLIHEGGASSIEEKELYAKLMRLQMSIYYLDHYLETNWNCIEEGLDKNWHEIHACLQNDFHISESDIPDYVKHIKKYQKHELELREGLMPYRLDMEYFYFYKSCDVKLIRRLIYEAYPDLNKKYHLVDWRYFDLITEVNDDVEDIFEDLETINGNRFLITAQMKGIDTAQSEFYAFIKDIEQRNSQRSDKKGLRYQRVYSMTNDMIKGTKALLQENASLYEKNHIDTHSKLTIHLNKTIIPVPK